MHIEAAAEERKRAKWLHELLLINLITNHILLFVALLGTLKSYPYLLLLVPAISTAIIVYILTKARTARRTESRFVACHWQLAARRSRQFIGVLLLMAGFIVALIVGTGGAPEPIHYAIGGTATLPLMVAVLVLIIMAQDGMHQAASGHLPDWLAEQVGWERAGA